MFPKTVGHINSQHSFSVALGTAGMQSGALPAETERKWAYGSQAGRGHGWSLSIRQNHDNDCARMSSCRNSKHFHLNIPPPFRRTRASLSALTHTPTSPSVLNYVRCKNCVSVFRIRPYIRGVHCRNTVISVWYSFTVTREVFCFIFLSGSLVVAQACECAISIAGSMNCRKGFR